MPERTVTVDGKKVTVRELTFLQGLTLSPVLQGLIQDLDGLFDTGEDTPDLDAVVAVCGRHQAAFVEAMAVATEKPVDWFAALPDADGEALLLTFWTVNRSFFTRRLVRRRALRRASESVPAPSSPSS